MNGKSLVYFIKPVRRKGPIKIGCSLVPADRLEALSAWSPWPLEVIGTVPGDFRAERFLHECFADAHTHREWFKATPFVLEYIAKIIAAGTIDVVRDQISPIRDIRNRLRRKRTDEQKLRQSYSFRVNHCERKTRKVAEAWHAPDDVCLILRRWHGYRRYDSKQGYVVFPPTSPSSEEIARLDQYLADPVPHSVVPSWKIPKDPICIPVFVEATPDEMAPAVSSAPISPSAAGANLSTGAACLN